MLTVEDELLPVGAKAEVAEVLGGAASCWVRYAKENVFGISERGSQLRSRSTMQKRSSVGYLNSFHGCDEIAEHTICLVCCLCA